MRRVVLLLGVAAFVAILVVLGWIRRPMEGTTTPSVDLPTVTGASPTTTIPTPTTSTTLLTATTTIPPAEIAPISAAEVRPVGFAPLMAISADEIWAVVGTAEDAACVIGHLNHEVWRYWGLTDRTARFRDLETAADGTVWAATDAGVFSFDGAAWTRRYGGPAGAVAVDELGRVWIAGNLEGSFPLPWLALAEGETWDRLDLAAPLGREGDTALAVLGGEAWLAAYPGTGDLLRYAGGTLEAVPIDGYPDPTGEEGAVGVFTVEATPNGDVWVGGFLASNPLIVVLARFDGTEWTLYDWPLSGGGERTALLFEVAAGPDGVVWLGGETGLAFFDGERWKPRLEGPRIRSLDVAPDGAVWYSDLEGSLYSLPAP